MRKRENETGGRFLVGASRMNPTPETVTKAENWKSANPNRYEPDSVRMTVVPDTRNASQGLSRRSRASTESMKADRERRSSKGQSGPCSVVVLSSKTIPKEPFTTLERG